MRRTSHQHGSLKLADRRKGKVWEFRWREVQIDGSVCRKNIVVGTLEEFPTESAAQSAVDAIRLTINRQTPQQLLKNVSVETLVKHYQEHELPDIFSKQKPATGSSDEHHKSYSTQYAYDIYLKKWVLPRWRSYRLSEVKAVDVEAWLKTMPLARGSRAKIRNLMSALFSHAIRWEWTERNPIQSVRQSAKRMRTPDVLTLEEIMALLKELPEPLRTAAELDAFTGLRRGELIGLQWEDVDFENLVIHVRRSVVMMVEGAPKTEASAKDVPLDAALAESLLKLRLVGPYNRETDWVFASPTMKGKQPLWPETLWRRYGRPAVKAAKIQKRVGFHTFRHTYTTLLTQNNEEVKVVQELLRHANSRITLDLYAQAGMPNKRLAQSKLVRMVLNKGEALA
ncbi:MAG: site-specific integrase [Solirubrobacteraceae bacterium]